MEQPKLQFSDRILAQTILPWIPLWVRPNAVTTVRFVAVPFVLASVMREQFFLAIVIFAVAAFTDLLDGALARTRNQITAVGKVIDPLADKLLIGTLMVAMVWVYLSAQLALIIISIEAFFIIGGFWRWHQGIVPSANLWGKIKFNFQVLGVVVLFVAVSSPNPVLWEIAATTSFAIAIVFALLSLATQGF